MRWTWYGIGLLLWHWLSMVQAQPGNPEPWPTPTWQGHPDAKQIDDRWVLYRPSLQPAVKGTIIFLFDAEQVPQALFAFDTLVHAGYHALATIPSLPTEIVRQTKQTYLNDVMTARPDKSGALVLVLSGIHAALGITELAEKRTELPFTLILYDTFFPAISEQENIISGLSALNTLPILDLWDYNQNPWLQANTRQRQWAMLRAGATSYRPYQLNSRINLGKRIYGWLKTLGL